MAELIWVAAAALVDTSGRILVQRRPQGGSHAGQWEFPGGKIEAGETPEIALARELAEELGIAVDPSTFTPVAFSSLAAGEKHLILMLFDCRRWSGAVQCLHAAALDWVMPSGLGALDMPDADKPLAQALVRHLQL